MRVFIVILHYGDKRETIACIKSIKKFEKKYYQIIVVDNTNSLNLTGKLPRGTKIHIIRNKKNLGFAGGVNVGVRYALEKRATHILLINNDAKLTQELIRPMQDFLRKNIRVGIIAPAIEFYKAEIKNIDLGGSLDKKVGRTYHNNVLKILQNNPIMVDYVSGCCMLIKAEVFSKVGLFDERFFLYYEDVDFCMRAKRKGYSSYVLPHVSIFHKLSKTVGKNSATAVYHQLRSSILFGKKYNKKVNKTMHAFFIAYQSLLMIYKNIHNTQAVLNALKVLSTKSVKTP